MSSPARNAEKRREHAARLAAAEEERNRIEGLSIFDRVQEATSLAEMGEVILLIARKAGLDIYAGGET